LSISISFVVTLFQWLIASEKGKLFILAEVGDAVCVEVIYPRVSRWCPNVLHTTHSLFW